jgi:hypothetical protein
MADATLLRKAMFKVVSFAAVAALGEYYLWPDVPVEEWMQDNVDWKLKFAFVAWIALIAGMAYDALVALAKGLIASPGTSRR